MIVELDDQGRLHIPRKLRDRYGERFRIVRLRGAIKLIPDPGDPVQALQDAMPGIQDVSLSRLRSHAEEAAREDARR